MMEASYQQGEEEAPLLAVWQKNMKKSEKENSVCDRLTRIGTRMGNTVHAVHTVHETKHHFVFLTMETMNLPQYLLSDIRHYVVFSFASFFSFQTYLFLLYCALVRHFNDDRV